MMSDHLAAAIAAIPFDDHHVHAPYIETGPLDADGLRRPFTESALPAVWNEHLPSQIGYRWMVRSLAGLLDVEPTEPAVLEQRSRMSVPDYHRLLADDCNLGESFADDLFAVGECYDVAEWSALLGGRPVRRVLRIETFVELGYGECPTLNDALHRLVTEIAAAPERGIVSLKSIAGYRTGLRIAPPSSGQRAQAGEAYRRLRDSTLAGGSGRIAEKTLIDTILWEALVASIPLRLPMQFHVALGDDDIVLSENDPAVMRALYLHEPFRAVPLVLLHCYPFHRHAGYMASLYPNVYVDLGLTIPIAGPASARIVDETLELTPVSQLLASTDGHMTPEFQWHGVKVWRWAMERVVAGYLEAGAIGEDEVTGIVSAVFTDNTRRIYPQYS